MSLGMLFPNCISASRSSPERPHTLHCPHPFHTYHGLCMSKDGHSVKLRHFFLRCGFCGAGALCGLLLVLFKDGARSSHAVGQARCPVVESKGRASIDFSFSPL